MAEGMLTGTEWHLYLYCFLLRRNYDGPDIPRSTQSIIVGPLHEEAQHSIFDCTASTEFPYGLGSVPNTGLMVGWIQNHVDFSHREKEKPVFKIKPALCRSSTASPSTWTITITQRNQGKTVELKLDESSRVRDLICSRILKQRFIRKICL
jgi:hypothetical protein